MRTRAVAVALGVVMVAFVLPAIIAPTAVGAQSLTVGVLDSALSKAFSAATPPHSYAQGIDIAGREQAAKTWVTSNGHNLVVLSDQDLANPATLAAVDVVILPYSIAMDEASSLTLRSWVKQGGSLIPILGAPRVFLENGLWKLWVLELNYEAWEWGPLSEAYQMMFVNDPSPSHWETTLTPGHPIVTDALGSLGLGSAKFTRPSGSGVEFAYKYSSNVTSILDFGGIPSPFSNFNGYSAAQATHYGAGRVVYFGIPLLDFLPYYNAGLAKDPVGGGHDQGDLADALLDAAVGWAANGGGYGSIVPSAVTWGEVDAWGTSIYVRQWVSADGTAPVSGRLRTSIYNPSGVLVSQDTIDNLGIEPGRTHMYNWSYLEGSLLDAGTYRVVFEYTFTYPTYTQASRAEAYVVRSQGVGIKTEPLSKESSGVTLTGDFDGSGATDVALFGETDGVWWVLGSQGSSFDAVAWADFSTSSGWEARVVGDFNGDGRDDIAQFHPSNGTWWISRSVGGSFTTELWADFFTSSGWEAPMVGDFNGDGRDDIAQFHPSNGTWWISRSVGGSFTTELWADFSTTSGWEARVVGDFNGDGRDDIVQTHGTSGTWWVSASTGAAFATTNWATFVP
jgi:hypothetical protein